MDDPGRDGCIEFCRRERPRLVGSLALYLGDAGVAEELAQEALVRVWERWDRVALMERPDAWLHRTALNLARSWFQRRAAERRAHQRAGAPAESSLLPDTPAAVAVRAAVAGLAPRQRAAVVARFYAGLDVAGAAVALGCSEGTVKALTHQAITRLRAAGLGHADETDEPEEALRA
ncbi:MAG: sigma-70 family RNA polymerase sigma factor [Acidimicrobiia bacterium]|nr:sigma-70 family RNA polymerase sigma factor [Acidimicrobiia bacterium]